MAVPVLVEGVVVAVLEFYLFAPREEDERLVRVVSSVAVHLGSTIVRKRMEEELRTAFRFRERMMEAVNRRNERLQALIHQMAEGVVSIDETGRVTQVNPAASLLLGRPGPLEELAIDQIGFPPPLVQALEEACTTAHSLMTEVRFTCGGTEIRALVSPMVGAQGSARGAVALLQDVTVEDRLKRMRENFVANVSHELRGPLAALSAGVEAMHDGLLPPDMWPRYLKRMLGEIGRLRRLTDSLLELSRLDAGILQVPMEPFDLALLVEDVAESWRPRAASRGIRLLVDAPPVLALGSVDRVEQVLVNLLDNAIRHTGQGGQIRLSVRPLGEVVRVEVADTGCGIDREHLEHIWERFHLTDPARTWSPERGTGLGLSICKQLVELMGGEVAVESELGVGSTFSFTLRAAPGA